MCMSIGWNPFYNNKEKTAEPWVLHDFDKVCALACDGGCNLVEPAIRLSVADN